MPTTKSPPKYSVFEELMLAADEANNKAIDYRESGLARMFEAHDAEAEYEILLEDAKEYAGDCYEEFIDLYQHDTI